MKPNNVYDIYISNVISKYVICIIIRCNCVKFEIKCSDEYLSGVYYFYECFIKLLRRQPTPP